MEIRPSDLAPGDKVRLRSNIRDRDEVGAEFVLIRAGRIGEVLEVQDAANVALVRFDMSEHEPSCDAGYPLMCFSPVELGVSIDALEKYESEKA